jgi:Na+-transporting NADH:ubiquinone oxidoreductase subunit NqrF
MSFFTDYVAALEAYPGEFLEILIENVDPDGDRLNEGERASFDIRVINNGPLDVLELQLTVTSLGDTTVAQNGAAAAFVDTFTTPIGQFETVPAHNGTGIVQNGSPFKFEVPDGVQPEHDLFAVTIFNWRADDAHLLRSHAIASAVPRAVHRDRVRAAT